MQLTAPTEVSAPDTDREHRRPELACGERPRSLPTEQATLKCVYLTIMSLGPTAEGRRHWSNRWKAALNAFETTFYGRHPPAGSELSHRKSLTPLPDRPVPWIAEPASEGARHPDEEVRHGRARPTSPLAMQVLIVRRRGGRGRGCRRRLAWRTLRGRVRSQHGTVHRLTWAAAGAAFQSGGCAGSWPDASCCR